MRKDVSLMTFSGDAYSNPEIMEHTNLLEFFVKNTPFVDLVYVAYGELILLVREEYKFTNKIAFAKSTKKNSILTPERELTLEELPRTGYTANDFAAGVIYASKYILRQMGYSNSQVTMVFAKSPKYIDDITFYLSKKYHIGDRRYYYMKISV